MSSSLSEDQIDFQVIFVHFQIAAKTKNNNNIEVEVIKDNDNFSFTSLNDHLFWF